MPKRLLEKNPTNKWYLVSTKNVNTATLALTYLKATNVKHIFGPFSVYLTADEHASFVNEMKEKTSDLKIEESLMRIMNMDNFVGIDTDWMYDDEDYILAITLGYDHSESKSFYDQVPNIFSLGPEGILNSIDHSKIKSFIIRYAQIIRAHSGSYLYVPKFNKNNSIGQNNTEALKAFIPVYTAYCDLSNNWNWKNEFNWNCLEAKKNDQIQSKESDNKNNNNNTMNGV